MYPPQSPDKPDYQLGNGFSEITPDGIVNGLALTGRDRYTVAIESFKGNLVCARHRV
jgi:hypothetical protein